jgi:hypothetical protein
MKAFLSKCALCSRIKFGAFAAQSAPIKPGKALLKRFLDGTTAAWE